jgi:hypothetical protein
VRLNRRFALSFSLALIAVFACVRPSVAQTIDHTTLPQFNLLTDDEIGRAAELRVSFVDRSVGANTMQGIVTLAHADPRFNADRIEFRGWPKVMPPPNPTCINGNGGWNGMWTGYGKCATQHWDANPGAYDAVTWWFDYLSGVSRNPLVKYFTPTTNAFTFDASDYLAWRAANPTLKTFAWTTSLPYADTPVGLLAVLDAFNVQMRASAPVTGEVLLDAADILTHDAAGVNCTHPASGKPRICQAWASDWAQGGGHLTAAGQARMARAVWLTLVAINRVPAR